MNILYIGPYKSESILGIQSRINLQYINTLGHNIYARNYGTDSAIVSDELYFLENKPIITNIDVIIEHKYISDTSINNICKKNILIPIFDILENIVIYQNYDDIIVSTEIEESILKQNNISSTILYQDNCLNIKDTQKDINLKFYQFTSKLYSILDMTTDQNIVYKLISFFGKILPKIYNHSLIILLNNSNEQIIKSIYDFISQYSQRCKIDLSRYILILNSHNCDIENIKAIHKNCDIFIDINNKESINTFNKHIANANKNFIIDNISEMSISNLEYNIDINYNKLLNYFREDLKHNKSFYLPWQNILK